MTDRLAAPRATGVEQPGGATPTRPAAVAWAQLRSLQRHYGNDAVVAGVRRSSSTVDNRRVAPVVQRADYEPRIAPEAVRPPASQPERADDPPYRAADQPWSGISLYDPTGGLPGDLPEGTWAPFDEASWVICRNYRLIPQLFGHAKPQVMFYLAMNAGNRVEWVVGPEELHIFATNPRGFTAGGLAYFGLGAGPFSWLQPLLRLLNANLRGHPVGWADIGQAILDAGDAAIHDPAFWIQLLGAAAGAAEVVRLRTAAGAPGPRGGGARGGGSRRGGGRRYSDSEGRSGPDRILDLPEDLRLPEPRTPGEFSKYGPGAAAGSPETAPRRGLPARTPTTPEQVVYVEALDDVVSTPSAPEGLFLEIHPKAPPVLDTVLRDLGPGTPIELHVRASVQLPPGVPGRPAPIFDSTAVILGMDLVQALAQSPLIVPGSIRMSLAAGSGNEFVVTAIRSAR